MESAYEFLRERMLVIHEINSEQFNNNNNNNSTHSGNMDDFRRRMTQIRREDKQRAIKEQGLLEIIQLSPPRLLSRQERIDFYNLSYRSMQEMQNSIKFVHASTEFSTKDISSLYMNFAEFLLRRGFPTPYEWNDIHDQSQSNPSDFHFSINLLKGLLSYSKSLIHHALSTRINSLPKRCNSLSSDKTIKAISQESQSISTKVGIGNELNFHQQEKTQSGRQASLESFTNINSTENLTISSRQMDKNDSQKLQSSSTKAMPEMFLGGVRVYLNHLTARYAQYQNTIITQFEKSEGTTSSLSTSHFNAMNSNNNTKKKDKMREVISDLLVEGLITQGTKIIQKNELNSIFIPSICLKQMISRNQYLNVSIQEYIKRAQVAKKLRIEQQQKIKKEEMIKNKFEQLQKQEANLKLKELSTNSIENQRKQQQISSQKSIQLQQQLPTIEVNESNQTNKFLKSTSAETLKPHNNSPQIQFTSNMSPTPSQSQQDQKGKKHPPNSPQHSKEKNGIHNIDCELSQFNSDQIKPNQMKFNIPNIVLTMNVNACEDEDLHEYIQRRKQENLQKKLPIRAKVGKISRISNAHSLEQKQTHVDTQNSTVEPQQQQNTQSNNNISTNLSSHREPAIRLSIPISKRHSELLTGIDTPSEQSKKQISSKLNLTTEQSISLQKQIQKHITVIETTPSSLINLTQAYQLQSPVYSQLYSPQVPQNILVTPNTSSMNSRKKSIDRQSRNGNATMTTKKLLQQQQLIEEEKRISNNGQQETSSAASSSQNKRTSNRTNGSNSNNGNQSQKKKRAKKDKLKPEEEQEILASNTITNQPINKDFDDSSVFIFSEMASLEYGAAAQNPALLPQNENLQHQYKKSSKNNNNNGSRRSKGKSVEDPTLLKGSSSSSRNNRQEITQNDSNKKQKGKKKSQQLQQQQQSQQEIVKYRSMKENLLSKILSYASSSESNVGNSLQNSGDSQELVDSRKIIPVNVASSSPLQRLLYSPVIEQSQKKWKGMLNKLPVSPLVSPRSGNSSSLHVEGDFHFQAKLSLDAGELRKAKTNDNMLISQSIELPVLKQKSAYSSDTKIKDTASYILRRHSNTIVDTLSNAGSKNNASTFKKLQDDCSIESSLIQYDKAQGIAKDSLLNRQHGVRLSDSPFKSQIVAKEVTPAGLNSFKFQESPFKSIDSKKKGFIQKRFDEIHKQPPTNQYPNYSKNHVHGDIVQEDIVQEDKNVGQTIVKPITPLPRMKNVWNSPVTRKMSNQLPVDSKSFCDNGIRESMNFEKNNKGNVQYPSFGVELEMFDLNNRDYSPQVRKSIGVNITRSRRILQPIMLHDKIRQTSSEYQLQKKSIALNMAISDHMMNIKNADIESLDR